MISELGPEPGQIGSHATMYQNQAPNENTDFSMLASAIAVKIDMRVPWEVLQR